MRITREHLLKIARDTAAQRARRSRGLVCAYLTGSLLSETPLLGGTTDIDLILIHDSEPPFSREIVRLTDEVHLDIAHYSQDRFAQPRRLRTDPWLGSYLCANPIPLHDTFHWFEFTQASGCAQFDQPEYTLQRARPLAEAARQSWFALQAAAEPGPEAVDGFLRVIENAGNALACLSGPPLPLRRFFLHLPQRAEAIGRPGLSAGLSDLLTGDRVDVDWDRFLPAWERALQAAAAGGDSCPPGLHPARHPYYRRAVEALHPGEPAAAAWILLKPWTQAVCFRRDEPALAGDYDEVRQAFGLDASSFSDRLEGADAYLDSLEEALDAWAERFGVDV